MKKARREIPKIFPVHGRTWPLHGAETILIPAPAKAENVERQFESGDMRREFFSRSPPPICNTRIKNLRTHTK